MKENAITTETTLGIDLSRHQKKIDWATVEQAGVEFVFIKATEGATWVDPLFTQNWHGARINGIMRGAYHFFRPNSPVEKQVDNFVRTVGKLEVGDLPPVLDIEVIQRWLKFSLKKRLELVHGWLDGVESELGVKPIVYLNPSFANQVLENSPTVKDYILWLAHYTSRPSPRVPLPWTDWDFWQYSETGTVDGIDVKAVDLNRFNGSLADLKKLTVQNARFCNCTCSCNN